MRKVKQILYAKKQKYYHSEIKRKRQHKRFYVYCTLWVPFTSPETGKMYVICK